MPVRHRLAPLLCIMLAALVTFDAIPASAQGIGHFGKNRLEFEPVGTQTLPNAMGTGIVDYEGSQEPESQWRASFRFTGLEASDDYTVVIKGRFGERGSPEAVDLTPLCSFTTDTAGEGGCFWYFRGLARLNLVQLRAGDKNGSRVLEASRGGGPGSIETDPNRFSPGGEIPTRKRSRNDRNSQ